MKLEDIPADVLMTLTSELERLFRFADCNPACHACKKYIEIGDQFQLLSFDGTDEMTCAKCDRKELERQKHEALVEQERLDSRPRSLGGRIGGYSRPSIYRT